MFLLTSIISSSKTVNKIPIIISVARFTIDRKTTIFSKEKGEFNFADEEELDFLQELIFEDCPKTVKSAKFP